jgi:hypothetical protein
MRTYNTPLYKIGDQVVSIKGQSGKVFKISKVNEGYVYCIKRKTGLCCIPESEIKTPETL